jgi:hypothetical protein
MLNVLEVPDPLADQAVTIVVRVQADNDQRAERTVLVTVGLPNQVPVLVTGRLTDLLDLIDQAWLRYGARSPVPTATTATVVATAVVGNDEADDDGEADSDVPGAEHDALDEGMVSPGGAQRTDHPAPVPSPKASILSLF